MSINYDQIHTVAGLGEMHPRPINIEGERSPEEISAHIKALAEILEPAIEEAPDPDDATAELITDTGEAYAAGKADRTDTVAADVIGLDRLQDKPDDSDDTHRALGEQPVELLVEAQKILESSGLDAASEVVSLNPGKEVTLYNGKKEHRFGVREELDPLEAREIETADGSRKTANIILKIKATGSPFDFAVAEREGQFAGVTTDPAGKTQLTRMGSGNQISFRDGDQWYTAERFDTAKDGLSWRFFQSGWADRPVSVILNDGAEVVKHPKTAHEISIEKKHSSDRKKKWIKRAVGLAATWATLSSGGFADRLGEGIVDTDKVVAAASNLNPSPEPFTMETELDGIKVKDYPHPQEMIDEQNEEIRAEQAKNERSERAVKEVMSDLDGHNYEEIKKRAQEYLADNPGELMEKNELSQIRQNIESASTVEEVMAAISELGQFYGITFDQSEPELDRLQNTALSVFNVLSTLPKTVVEQSQLKKVGFRSSADGVMDAGSIGTVQGYYSEADDSLDLYSKSRQGEAGMRVLSSGMPGSQEDYSLESVFAHEFGHSLTLKGKVGSSGEVGLIGAKYVPEVVDILPSVAVDVVRSGLANYPSAMSTYSRSNYRESMAENIGGVIHDRSDGLAHPDEARRFNSPANKVLVRNLMDLETLQPGLADYFVSINPRLMNRNITTFGR